jgi:hypothetical protein
MILAVMLKEILLNLHAYKKSRVKRFLLSCLSILGVLQVLGQDPSQPQNRVPKDERKQAKRERINQLMRLEEEGEPSYRKHTMFGGKLNHDGWGISYEWGKLKSPYKATIYQIEYNEKKHPKEEKQSTSDNLGGGFIVLGNPFVYGKQNHFYQVKFGIGQQVLFGGKANKNGVGVYVVYAGGLSLGLLRPYYVEVESPPNSGQVKTIKYSEADSAEFLGPFIVGGTGFSKGWGDMQFRPGAHAKAALRFDWGRFNNSITALEFGFNFEYYPQTVVQMATIEGKNFFANGYISLLFGRRK